MPIELPPQYDPKSVEKTIYQKWLDAGAFHAVPDARPPEKRYSIVIPPPNVTGALHLGHAINGTIQDVLTRYHRMKGDNTLWMPGIDHAGIATQAVVEKSIFEKEHKNRHDLGRDELVRRIWEWKEQFGTRILSQLQSIGSSCDWERTRFTLDEVCAKAVREAFFKMFKDGLIFRGKRLVNWDTHLQTAVADDEIYHETVKGQMTSIKYPVAEDANPSETQSEPRPLGSDQTAPESEYLIVATTRPETMLGDTAVAVHPDDPRYTHLHGKFVIVPLIGRRIPVVCDGLLVDPKFGTGVVKVTPAHDPNDYATGVRHNLEQINLLTPDGKVNESGQGEFRGKHYSYVGLKFATTARKQVLEDLESLGLIADKKPHEHEVGHSDRSKTPIEPYLSDQWFVRMGDITHNGPSEPRPSGSDRATIKEESGPAHSNAAGYFITFHTYATWLHGQEPGSVDPDHNIPGTPFVAPNPALLDLKFKHARQPPFALTLAQRQSVMQTIQEVARHRGWTLHAVNVRTTHVHIVVSGKKSPERMMNDFKSYATRRMTEAGLLPPEAKVWSRHGSTPYLWKSSDVAGAADYVLHRQGENASGTFFTEPRPSGSEQTTMHAQGSLPNGRGSDGVTLADGTRAPGLAQAAIDAVTSGRVKITPERYAKGYVDWLSQKRDWCISRQLWWGHRIPIWTRPEDVDPVKVIELYKSLKEKVGNRISMRDFPTGKTATSASGEPLEGIEMYFCVAPESADIEEILNSWGFTQDPDVLDTWFSSALWPISTMGWPGGTPFSSTWSRAMWDGENYTEAAVRAYFQKHVFLPALNNDAEKAAAAMQSFDCAYTGKQLNITFRDPAIESAVRATILTMGYIHTPSDTPEPDLLPYFYPTNLLSTAREILTLWVARMVIFGLYCKGDVPFRDVYIHAIIQDGEGRPMKKTLGNGVDPVDIVHSHGADALRFTLASMATETQDIRLPVQLVCPHCHERLPNNINGPIVIGCPKCKKQMTRPVQTAVPTDAAPMSHSTSDRFDLGRNFANKIWNAARYILGNVGEEALGHQGTQALGGTALEDRWILSRLHQTIRAAETAINAYRFADMAEALRSFFWTDLCDWYLEIAKARIKSGDAQVQTILLHGLRTALKLLHPVMPFITEELWEKLETQNAKLKTLLITAPWPQFNPARIDTAAETQLALIQSVTSAIREIQNRYPAAKGKDVILAPRDAATQQLIEQSRTIIEPLVFAKIAENSLTAAKPENAAATILPEAQIFIGGVIDKATETLKLTKRADELRKLIAGNETKLANEAFTSKAPPKIIQGLRDQLAKLNEELVAVEKNLGELGG